MNILLLADGLVGLEVAKHLVASDDIISALYLHPESKRQCGEEIIEAAKVSPNQVFEAYLTKDPDHILEVQKLAPDFIVTVYWAYLLRPEFYRIAKETLNFHPALLPINRGWYPHVHSIIDGTPCGVTLHAIHEDADTGPIWVQKEVVLEEADTSDKIYDRLQLEIVQLFKDNWDKIKTGSIEPSAQDHSKAIYHGKNEIDGLDEIDFDAPTTARTLIQQLKARTFKDKGFAYYRVGDRKYYVRINLREEGEVQ